MLRESWTSGDSTLTTSSSTWLAESYQGRGSFRVPDRYKYHKIYQFVPVKALKFIINACACVRAFSPSQLQYEFNPRTADWSRESRGFPVTCSPSLRDWMLFHTPRNTSEANSLVHFLSKVCGPLGIDLGEPSLWVSHTKLVFGHHPVVTATNCRLFLWDKCLHKTLQMWDINWYIVWM